MTWLWAIALRPLVYFVLFVLVIAPITWLLYKIIPPGRFKIFLFKVRTGDHASRRDKLIITLAVIGFYILFFGSMGWYMSTHNL